MRRLGVLVLVLAMLSFIAAPAAASPPGGFDPSNPPAPDPNPAGPATEATIVEMIHTSGLFGGDVPTAGALTPYPTTGLENERSVTTAQIVLDDPAGATDETILTYCVDLDTETTIGIHYELGDWTAANVPNLPYVQWILENHYPQVPASPSTGTDAEKVRAVQGAIWYFTDRFVVSPAYPAERAAVAAIVAAAQSAVGPAPAPPPLPTLTITPATRDASAPGQIVGPFVVGGSVASATLVVADTPVYADAAGTTPLANGATVSSGATLWARYEPDAPAPGLALSAVATVPAGNVFLYDGGNPPRTTAQKLVLAASADVPLRAAASIGVVPVETGTFAVDLVITGDAAGQQSSIVVEAVCDVGDEVRRATFGVAAGATGTVRAGSLSALPVGSTCSASTPSDGANAGAVLSSSTAVPASVTIGAAETSVTTLTNVYAIAEPSPSPSPTRTALAASGAGAVMPWGWGAAAAVLGIVLLAGATVRARRSSGR